MANMMMIMVTDVSMSKKTKAEVPSDKPMEKILPVLAQKLNLAGESWEAINKRTQEKYTPTDTLESAGTQEGDLIQLMAQIKGA